MTNLRDALKERHRDVAKARQAEQAAAKLHDQSRGNVERASALLASRRAELAAHDAAVKIGDDGMPLEPSAAELKARRDLVDGIGVAERMLATVKSYEATQAQALSDARQALHVAERAVADRINPVIDEVSEALILKWQDARAKAYDAERSLRSMMTALTSTQRFAQAEKLSTAFRAGSQRLEYVADAGPWLNLFEQLKHDATATARVKP
jgi:hypothetical protein